MRSYAALSVLAAALALWLWHMRAVRPARPSPSASQAPLVKPAVSVEKPVRPTPGLSQAAKARALREAGARQAALEAAQAQAAADQAAKEAAQAAAAKLAADAAADKAAQEAARIAAAKAAADAAAQRAAQEAAAKLQVSSHSVVAPQGTTQGQKNWAQCCADAGGAWTWGPEDGQCWDDQSCQAKWGCCAAANYNDKVPACRFARSDRGHFRARFRCLGR